MGHHGLSRMLIYTEQKKCRQYLDASGLPFRANDDVVLCDVKGLLTIVISYCLADTTIQPE